MDVANHGGNIYEFNKDIIDFSSNINPLGYPEKLKKGLIENFQSLLKYPDINYTSLKENLEKYLQVEKDFIQVGNGAVEIIDLVISLFKRLIIIEPSFSEYRIRANVHGLEIISVNLEEDMSLDISKLKENIQEGDLVILTSPHNPTGKTLLKSELLDIYLDVVEKNAYLLLDEVFFEFASLDYDSINLFKPLGFCNVGIIRAATKFFGLPGLRLGYGVFSLDMIDNLKKRELAWSINSLAVIASDYIYDNEFIKRSKEYIIEAREIFIENLREIKNVYPYKSNANYILVKLDNIDESYLYKKLIEKNILVRRCSNYKNLDKTHIRVAVKTKEENYYLVEELKKIMVA